MARKVGDSGHCVNGGLPLGVVDIWVSALAIPGFLYGVGLAAQAKLPGGRD